MSETMKWGQLAVIVILAGAAAWFVVRSYARSLSRSGIMARIFALILVIVGVGIGAGSFFESFFPPIFAVIATGLVTFFGLLIHALRGAPDARLEDRDIRIAIAASITTLYLVLVGYGVWVSDTGRPDPIAQSLMTSLSAVVGTVIAFYFGATAYLEGKSAGSRAQETKKENPKV
jgi:hypothetical protein